MDVEVLICNHDKELKPHCMSQHPNDMGTSNSLNSELNEVQHFVHDNDGDSYINRANKINKFMGLRLL